MTVAPDLRFGASPADERIIRRHRTIGTDADDFAEVVAEILRLVASGEMIARGEKKIVIRRLHDAAAEMIAAGERTCLAEDDLERIEPWRAFVDQPRAGGRAAAGDQRTGAHDQ